MKTIHLASKANAQNKQFGAYEQTNYSNARRLLLEGRPAPKEESVVLTGLLMGSNTTINEIRIQACQISAFRIYLHCAKPGH